MELLFNYSSIDVIETAAGSVTKDYSGPLKVIHVVYLVVILFLIIGAIIWGLWGKGTYSRKILLDYTFISVIGLVIYGVETLARVDFSFLPFLYTVAVIGIARSYDRIQMHDISCMLSEQQVIYNTKGFIALDYKGNFLSCNDVAYLFCPFLKKQREDEALPDQEILFREMIDEYKKNSTKSR